MTRIPSGLRPKKVQQEPPTAEKESIFKRCMGGKKKPYNPRTLLKKGKLSNGNVVLWSARKTSVLFFRYKWTTCSNQYKELDATDGLAEG